jgi:uncharacterized membrane protein
MAGFDTQTHFSSDLSAAALWATLAFAIVALGVLAWESKHTQGLSGRMARTLPALSGALAVLALAFAILRPLRITSRETRVLPRIAVLVDGSRSMNLKDAGESRKAHRDKAVASIATRAKLQDLSGGARLEFLEFGERALHPFVAGAEAKLSESQLGPALRALDERTEDRPDRIVVVSDGKALAIDSDLPNIPIDVVATTKIEPEDASLREVSLSGTAVAHVPLPIRVRIGCSRGLSCEGLSVAAKELREDGPPALLATGLVHMEKEEAILELPVTLDRAGPRILEISLTTPTGDEIPENNTRYLPVVVTHERIRVLHVAGRATSDMRALRRWLKNDASVDVVAFFILRTPTDNPQASQEDLALIPFPVDELFREHLSSFDAVVLQDFDAQPYGLERHLPAIAAYVRRGGGLIMVGGPNSFVAGGYAGTPLASVLPIELDGNRGATASESTAFVPSWTEEGREAPLLSDLRETLGTDLPPMPGFNLLGELRSGATALWSHPSRTLPSGRKMPVLAIGEYGDGRSIALGIDGSWQLEFSALGSRTGGRGFAALWDGLLGWLMRDPRFEPMHVEFAKPCMAGQESVLELKTLPTSYRGRVQLEIRPIDGNARPPLRLTKERSESGPLNLALPPLPAGGYVARVKLGDGVVTRRDFACEAGGDEWADTRPGLTLLQTLAKRNTGTFHFWNETDALSFPKPTVLRTDKQISPLAPAWLLCLVAAMLLGLHWLLRRRSGLR